MRGVEELQSVGMQTKCSAKGPLANPGDKRVGFRVSGLGYSTVL